MAVTGLDIRVMIFMIGHEADRVDKAQRVMEVVEFEILDDGLAISAQLPTRHLAQQRGYLRAVKGVLAAFARLAMLGSEVDRVHAEVHGLKAEGEASKLRAQKSKRALDPKQD